MEDGSQTLCKACLGIDLASESIQGSGILGLVRGTVSLVLQSMPVNDYLVGKEYLGEPEMDQD